MKMKKSIKGKLFDISNNNPLADIFADVTFYEPRDENDKPKYEVFLLIEGYKPELAERSHILNLNDKISGEVFITVDGIPGVQTRYKCFLQDEKWNKLEWFQAL
jgi:hypothetical protein